jgi:Uma2 family endonuclease
VVQPVSPPDGFDPMRLETWPQAPGRYEFVEGRLEYLPPCGEIQQSVAVDVLTELNNWRRSAPGFTVGANEAGMLLGKDVRAADAAVWPHQKPTQGLARVAPILAVEVAGDEDTLEYLEQKAEWYLSHGVETVWLVLPETRTVRVIARGTRTDIDTSGRIPEHPSLPGLAPVVASFFQQL